MSLFARYSTLTFTPDVVGDMLYDGIAQSADKTDTAGGVQAEGVYHLNDAPHLRGGVIVEIDRSTSDTTSQVMLLRRRSPAGRSATTPHTIVDNGAHDRRDLQRLSAGRVEAGRAV